MSLNKKRTVRTLVSVACLSISTADIVGCAAGNDESTASDVSVDGSARDVLGDTSPPPFERDSTVEASPTELGDAFAADEGDGWADVAETGAGDSVVADSSLPEGGEDVYQVPREGGEDMDAPMVSDATDATDTGVADVVGDEVAEPTDAQALDSEDQDVDTGVSDGGPTTTLGALAVRGSTCTACAEDSGCLDPATSDGVYCEQLSGGDVGTCVALLQCIESAGCNENSDADPTLCFCGDADPCFDVDSTPDGPCIRQYFAAAPTGVDPSYFAYELFDTTSAVGIPGALGQCLIEWPTGGSCPACFE